MGKQFIVLVDAHSKWLEVSVVSSCSSQQAIKFLRHVFSTHGLPEVLVSDNGSAFVSEEFQMFVKRSQPRIQEFAMGGAVYQRGGNVCEAV